MTYKITEMIHTRTSIATHITICVEGENVGEETHEEHVVVHDRLADPAEWRRDLDSYIDSYIASRNTSPDNERFREIDRHIDSYIAQRQSNKQH